MVGNAASAGELGLFVRLPSDWNDGILGCRGWVVRRPIGFVSHRPWERRSSDGHGVGNWLCLYTGPGDPSAASDRSKILSEPPMARITRMKTWNPYYTGVIIAIRRRKGPDAKMSRRRGPQVPAQPSGATEGPDASAVRLADHHL
jgi:hypothetical protein